MNPLYHLLPTKKPTSKTKTRQRKPRWRSLAAFGMARELIRWLWWGMPRWRLLAALTMMFLAACCFPTLFMYRALILKAMSPAQGLAATLGATFLLWGFAQALIIFAAYQLGKGAQPPPLEKWPFLQGYLGLWVLSALGTIGFVCVAATLLLVNMVVGFVLFMVLHSLQ